MADTLQTQLDRVQAAIAAIESGAQEYTIGARAFKKADLKTLYDRERDLMERIAQEANGTRAYAAFGGWGS